MAATHVHTATPITVCLLDASKSHCEPAVPANPTLIAIVAEETSVYESVWEDDSEDDGPTPVTEPVQPRPKIASRPGTAREPQEGATEETENGPIVFAKKRGPSASSYASSCPSLTRSRSTRSSGSRSSQTGPPRNVSLITLGLAALAELESKESDEDRRVRQYRERQASKYQERQQALPADKSTIELTDNIQLYLGLSTRDVSETLLRKSADRFTDAEQRTKGCDWLCCDCNAHNSRYEYMCRSCRRHTNRQCCNALKWSEQEPRGYWDGTESSAIGEPAKLHTMIAPMPEILEPSPEFWAACARDTPCPNPIKVFCSSLWESLKNRWPFRPRGKWVAD
ncbi:hypothetical protein QBC46DRAFT_404950 [Diplogelasinospora grovesii]|uniref:RanBP2-type domain-containing protein n=1 Tax=Diplogelasinospora grovesii TaxID=303347 RepID=A0AAN6S8L1_9PEZI|nr:hypothetical protein QBC46DRAFT_404950 [Diplogelasinospora grovesii]